MNELKFTLKLTFSLNKLFAKFQKFIFEMVWIFSIYGNLKYWMSDLSFNWFWLLENLESRYFLMTISIKNGRYAFLIRIDLMFSISLWKDLQLFEIFNHLSIRHLIKLILQQNDVKLLYRSICDMFEVRGFDYCYLKWIHRAKQWNC